MKNIILVANNFTRFQPFRNDHSSFQEYLFCIHYSLENFQQSCSGVSKRFGESTLLFEG